MLRRHLFGALLVGSVVLAAAPALAGSEADGGNLLFGQSVSRTISPAGDKDNVTFSAKAGQRATIRMNKSGGSSLDPFLRLFRPDKSLLAVDDDSGGDLNALINDVLLPVKGKYKIESSGFGTSVGEYILTLTLSGGGGGGCSPNSDQVALFRDANFGGACVVKGIGNHPNPGALSPLGNDEASSIRVGGNVRAVVYRDNDFAGTSETFLSDDSNLSDNAIGSDQISSMKVEPRGACSPNADQVALFRDANFSGPCVVKGIGDYPNPGTLSPLSNDDATSVRVGGNVKAILYRDDNFAGTSDTFLSDDSNLSDNAIGNDQVSSMKVQNR